MTADILPFVRKRLDSVTLGKNRFNIMYVEEDEDNPDLERLLDQILARGIDLEDGSVAPVLSRSIFGSIQKSYDEEEGSGFLYQRIIKTPCLQTGIDLVEERDEEFDAKTLISLSPKILDTFHNEPYYSPEVIPRTYSELRMVTGGQYDGSFDIPELEPFVGCYFGKIPHMPYVVDFYADQRLYAEGIELPYVNREILKRVLPFRFLIPSIEHKEFSFVESDPEIFQQRMNVFLSYVDLKK